MATPNPQLEAPLAQFAGSGVSRYQVAQLRGALAKDMTGNRRSTINASPFLANELKKSAAQIDQSHTYSQGRAQFEDFGFLRLGVAAEGTCGGSNRIMSLPLRGLHAGLVANPYPAFYAQQFIS
ncbi:MULTISPECIES: hypothetical protein [unclassified Xanthomonas]|uniref:hypothetical protein n=1 Tax=unclassified Xanthomonas TaxID=2643310 RepID=UPI0028834D30|nr:MULTISPECIES: hypothetical protein [unclassified Xanthomonas]